MDVRNCKSCGRLFNYMGGKPICSSCVKKLEDKFREVKLYLDENPHASVGRVAEDNDVAVKQIKQWVKEDRLVLSEASVDGVLCEQCGTPIRSGRFCDKCKSYIQNELSTAITKPKPAEPVKRPDTDKNKMRFLQ